MLQEQTSVTRQVSVMQIKQLLSKQINIPPDEISTTANFSRYGLNSISAVTLAGELEDLYAITIDPTLLLDYDTIEKLFEYIKTQIN